MILGIDAGGTKTRAIVMNKNGDIIYRGTGGPGNHFVVGEEGVIKALTTALSKYEGPEFDIAIISAAGAGFSAESRAYIINLSKKAIKAKKIDAYNDCYVALRGAIATRKKGMIILAGTGSMVIGMDEEKMYHKTGGWGHLLGDEGSGYRISYDAIRAVMKFWDGIGPYTPLVDGLIKYFKVHSVDDVIELFYAKKVKRNQVAAFSPNVINIARRGDFIAEGIVRKNIQKLLSGVGSVKMRINDDYVSYAGGMFNSSYYKNVVKEELKIMGFELNEPILSPIGGALFMGFSELGLLNDKIMEKLKKIK